MTAKGFVLWTLAIVIGILLLRNTQAFSKIITTVTGMFGDSFRAVTSVGRFK